MAIDPYQGVAPGYVVPRDEIAEYIRQAAVARGIDPQTALTVYRREGINNWQSQVTKDGQREPSFGPYQLYTGGGLGNKFQKETGLDPRDPNTWRHNVDFALDEARQGGWGPWYGARAAGITGFKGIGAAPQSASRPPPSPNLTPASPGQPPPPPQWAQQFPSPPTPPQMASAPGQSLSPGITPPIAPPIPAPRPDIGASDPLGGIASAFSSLGAMGEGSAPAPAAPPPPPMARAPTQDTLAPFLAQYMATVLGRRY
jgi:hypothetical protein